MSKGMTTEEFIQKAQAIYGNTYDYSQVQYVNQKTPVCIICPTHGKYEITPETHLKKHKCPECECLEWNAKYRLRNNLEKGGIYTIEFPTTFVAIDFETLYSDQLSACSVGMVKYHNGIIVDRYNSYICPPWDVEYKDSWAANVHHIRKEDVELARTMVDVLPEIEHFIDHFPLVAHHATTERYCFDKTCKYYGLLTNIDYDHILDTELLSPPIEMLFGKKIYKGKGSHELTTLCHRFNVPELTHHIASNDAEMCGNLFIQLGKVFHGEITIEFKDESSQKRFNEELSLQLKTIKPKSTIIPEQTPFFGKIVVISGFPKEDKEAYKQAVQDMGAKVTTNVSRRTNLLICGPTVGPEKYKSALAFGTSLMNQDEFYSFLDIY